MAVSENTVVMLKGSTPFGESVDFGSKAKTRVITQIVPREDDSGKDVAMFWAYRNGGVTALSFFVPAGGRPLAADEQAHGIQQKIGDSYSQVSEPDDVQMVVELTLDNLLAGRWAKQTEGSTPGISGLTSDLIEAVRRSFVASNSSRIKEFRDPEVGKIPAKDYLITKYNAVLDRANELRVPTGDEVVDAANSKMADTIMKTPFASVVESAVMQLQLAAIKREKAEAAEMRKLANLQAAVGDSGDFE